MKKFFMLLAVGLLSMSAFAETTKLELRCSEEVKDINGVKKDVKVLIYTDYKVNPPRFQLSITTKPENSPSNRHNPTQNDPINFKGYVSEKGSHGDVHKLFTDDRKNGYNLIADGDLFREVENDACASYVTLTLESIGSPSLKVNGEFSCSSICDM